MYHQEVEFAPIGLINMYNSGGAIDAVEAIGDSSCNTVRIKGRGEGVCGAYSNAKPMFCKVNMEEVEFKWSSEDHFLKINVPRGTISWEMDIQF